MESVARLTTDWQTTKDVSMELRGAIRRAGRAVCDSAWKKARVALAIDEAEAIAANAIVAYFNELEAKGISVFLGSYESSE